MRRAVLPITALLTLLALPLRPAGSAGLSGYLSRPAAASCPTVYRPSPQPAAGRVVSIPLHVALEWNTQGTNALAQWGVAVQRAAQFLAEATNGQASIRPIVVTDDACGWADADVRVYAHNTGYPDATIGGIPGATIASIGGRAAGIPPVVAGGTVGFGGAFATGTIRLGRSWSEFGPRRGRFSDPDGFTTIVHELGHYAFYLYDEYFTYDDTNPANPRPAADCSAPRLNPAAVSIMDWEYTRYQFWNGAAAPLCTGTMQWHVYQAPDWKVMQSHYPGLTIPPAPASPVPPSVAWAPCPGSTCVVPGKYRWLVNLDPYADREPGLLADGYLMKDAGTRALHEGVPYPDDPKDLQAIPKIDPLAASWYPESRLEILGGDGEDVARVTLTQPDGNLLQLVQERTHPPVVHQPLWYTGAAASQVPAIDVQPQIADALAPNALTGLRITASDPAGAVASAPNKGLKAILFEAGRLGPHNTPRRPKTILLPAGAGIYSGTLDLTKAPYITPTLLDGSLYLTPQGPRHEPHNKIAGGAWALAYYSLACNVPSTYMTGHAPGDEGGLDSADGVVNVHLTLPGPADLCAAFTRQPIVVRLGLRPLGATYGIHLSRPLPAGQAVITLHYDPDQVPAGSVPAVGQAPLPGVPGRLKGPSLLGGCSNPSAGGVSVAVPPAAIDGLYQVVLTTGATAAALQARCNLRGAGVSIP